MRSLQRLLVRFGSCCSGAALVETTILLPILLMLFAGTFEFGRAYYDYHVVDKAVRGASRYLARVASVADEKANVEASAENEIVALTGAAPGDVTITSGEAGGVVSFRAVVELDFPIFAFFFADPSRTFDVEHAQPYLGE